jgi:hypothetical protein
MHDSYLEYIAYNLALKYGILINLSMQSRINKWQLILSYNPFLICIYNPFNIFA